MATHTFLVNDTFISETRGEVRDAQMGLTVTVDRLDGEGATRTPQQMLDAALADATVPAVYSEWSPQRPELRVEERHPSVVALAETTITVKIICVYRLQRTNPSLPQRGGASLASIKRRTYPGLAADQPAGEQIVVTHEGKDQGGEIDVLAPEDAFELERVFSTNDPAWVVDLWKGKVNGDVFASQPAGQWLIVAVDYEAVNLAVNPAWFRFRFEFNKAPTEDGWDPSVIYKDSEKGVIPSDLVEGVGIKTIVNYVPANFGAQFELTNPVSA